MRLDKKYFVIGALLGLCVATLVWALTTDQIWQSVYDSTNQAIRINQVTP